MVDPTKRTYIGNRRPNSVGAWRAARAAGSVCAESLCFEIPRLFDRCDEHAKQMASQPVKELDE